MVSDATLGGPTLDQVQAKAGLLHIEVTPERAGPILRGARHLRDAVEQLNRFIADQEPSAEPHR